MRTASLTYAMTKFSTFALFGLFGVGLCVAVRMLVKWSGLQDDEDGKNPVDVGTPCFVTKLIKIPAESVGRVVGRYGRNLRRIEKQTKAFIQLMRDNKYGDGCSMFGYQNEEDWSVSCCGNNAHGPTSEFRCIEIRAETPERIRLACLAIYGHVAEARVHEITKCMFIPNNLMEPVVGNNWNDIKNLQARYKVRIEISQMFEGGDRMVSITGHKNNVELAENWEPVNRRCLRWRSNTVLLFPAANAFTTTQCGSIVSPFSQLVFYLMAPSTMQAPAVRSLANISVLLWLYFVILSKFYTRLDHHLFARFFHFIKKEGSHLM